jgi:hypothetical protein
MVDYNTACRCGKMIKISYNPGEVKELVCDNCSTTIKFYSSDTGVIVHFIPSS